MDTTPTPVALTTITPEAQEQLRSVLGTITAVGDGMPPDYLAGFMTAAVVVAFLLAVVVGLKVTGR